jgi:hypothetical protein
MLCLKIFFYVLIKKRKKIHFFASVFFSPTVFSSVYSYFNIVNTEISKQKNSYFLLTEPFPPPTNLSLFRTAVPSSPLPLP